MGECRAVNHRLPQVIVTLAVALALVGCQPAPPAERLGSDDPQVRVGAVYDLTQVPGAEADVRLIHRLADEDTAVRLFASTALAKRTGQRFGYLPAAPLAERAASIRQWVRWCETTYPETSGQFEDLNEWLKNFPDGEAKGEEPAGEAGQGS
jgi:hypothetical protein